MPRPRSELPILTDFTLPLLNTDEFYHPHELYDPSTSSFNKLSTSARTSLKQPTTKKTRKPRAKQTMTKKKEPLINKKKKDDPPVDVPSSQQDQLASSSSPPRPLAQSTSKQSKLNPSTTITKPTVSRTKSLRKGDSNKVKRDVTPTTKDSAEQDRLSSSDKLEAFRYRRKDEVDDELISKKRRRPSKEIVARPDEEAALEPSANVTLRSSIVQASHLSGNSVVTVEKEKNIVLIMPELDEDGNPIEDDVDTSIVRKAESFSSSVSPTSSPQQRSALPVDHDEQQKHLSTNDDVRLASSPQGTIDSNPQTPGARTDSSRSASPHVEETMPFKAADEERDQPARHFPSSSSASYDLPPVIAERIRLSGDQHDGEAANEGTADLDDDERMVVGFDSGDVTLVDSPCLHAMMEMETEHDQANTKKKRSWSQMRLQKEELDRALEEIDRYEMDYEKRTDGEGQLGGALMRRDGGEVDSKAGASRRVIRSASPKSTNDIDRTFFDDTTTTFPANSYFANMTFHEEPSKPTITRKPPYSSSRPTLPTPQASTSSANDRPTRIVSRLEERLASTQPRPTSRRPTQRVIPYNLDGCVSALIDLVTDSISNGTLDLLGSHRPRHSLLQQQQGGVDDPEGLSMVGGAEVTYLRREVSRLTDQLLERDEVIRDLVERDRVQRRRIEGYEEEAKKAIERERELEDQLNEEREKSDWFREARRGLLGIVAELEDKILELEGRRDVAMDVPVEAQAVESEPCQRLP